MVDQSLYQLTAGTSFAVIIKCFAEKLRQIAPQHLFALALGLQLTIILIID